MNRCHKLLLIIVMILSGACNTLLIKFQDRQVVSDCSDNEFDAPVFQTIIMALGECLCVFPMLFRLCRTAQGIKEPTELKPPPPFYVFGLCALFDMCGTSAMNVSLGVLQIAPSVYQMLRSFSIIFVATLSFFFLKRKINRLQLLGIFCIVFGSCLVGYASVRRSSHSSDQSIGSAILGVVLIILAQLFVGCHFVVEEKFISGTSISPLTVVSTEGMFILILSSLIYPLASYIHLDNFSLARCQVMGSSPLQIGIGCTAISIAIFNLCGVSVTKHISSTARAVVDGSRVIAIWAGAIYLGWETIGLEIETILQVAGFTVLVLGTMFYFQIGFKKSSVDSNGVETLDLINDLELDDLASMPELEM